MRTLFYSVIIFLLWAVPSVQATEITAGLFPAGKEPKRVLFVGNSFSFYNSGVHNYTANLVRAAGEWETGKQRFRLLTLSGGRLREHAQYFQSYLLNTKPDWDLIIFQDHSSGPITEKEDKIFAKAAVYLADITRKAGIEPSFFMTWPYEGKPEMTYKLARAYRKVGKDTKSPVFPVGLAFSRVTKNHPEISLYIPDVLGVKEGKITYRKTLKHPSVAGSYLAACVFYIGLYGKSPVGNPYRAGLPAEQAKLLQQAAWDSMTKRD